MYYAGEDIDAITAKAAIFSKDGRLASYAVNQAGYNRTRAAEEVLALALNKAGINQGEIVRLAATEYGRVQVPGAAHTITEITCHARGSYWLYPGVGTVIDIGGQDSKGISVGNKGRVIDFTMNDKCAAGTGRFFDVTAHALEVDLEQFGELSAAAQHRAGISSTCTVFAESEVVTHLAVGTPREEIIAGIHESITARISGRGHRRGSDSPGFLTGTTLVSS